MFQDGSNPVRQRPRERRRLPFTSRRRDAIVQQEKSPEATPWKAPLTNPHHAPSRPKDASTFFLLVVLAAMLSSCSGRPVAEPNVLRADLSELDALDTDATPPPGQITVATYNVHRFFDTVCDSTCEPGDYEELPSAEDFDAKAELVALSILKLDADVVLLQELETQAALDAVMARLPEKYHAVLGEMGSAASVDVAVVARAQILLSRRHRDQVLPLPDGGTTTFAREFLEVRLAWSQDAMASREPDVIAFVAHFRSKVSDEPARRLAEAVAARDIVSSVAAEFPDVLVVVGGDLNDVPESPPLLALLEGGLLLRVAADVPEPYTYFYNGKGQAIDHLLLAKNQGGDYVPESTKVVRNTNQHAFADSDHAALKAAFQRP